MNASARLFVTGIRRGRGKRLLACASLAALLAGCGSNPFATAEVDPASPIVSEVEAAGKPNRPFPKFTDIPKPPTDIRPLKAYRAAADAVEDARDQLERETAENTWTLNDTLKFEAGAQGAAGPDDPPSVQDAAATEALARRLRERATPPPLTR